MKEDLLQLFAANPGAALFISLLVNVAIAVIGILPSVFITAANILFFGFWPGTFISFLGEALGAAVSFWLYRKGFKKGADKQLQRFPKAQRLVQAKGREAFLLIFSLRLLPFVPSGLVTFAAAVGVVPALLFVLASSLGKIPALLIEAFAVQQVTDFGWQGKLILGVAAVGIIVWVLQRKPAQNL
ncbi:Uncharacterized membrane protein YdjX, TVP38/TMEM64 family, SNARE-associated domain [Cnuella takakiae]|uniref:TVP38/TMEM64 family membrane protein n=1 Tax=Cnuella takakiae TaxID=1302690 RepID=A0A1M5GVV5_9BACT|nr:VTT domain-containing protein [Cnuella takakiae]OLY90869.1 hypothetical protein BUE76_02380 [Cnuella takakiae]SHG07840.1 Uncharacterized membrane protein YdjX, TVP38/TMEM64 family, SNARE-associated domain [Cnuella takakiae]